MRGGQTPRPHPELIGAPSQQLSEIIDAPTLVLGVPHEPVLRTRGGHDRLVARRRRKAKLTPTDRMLGLQKIRTESAGRAVFTREMEMLARYRDGLGECGAQIAMHVRKLCRGAGMSSSPGRLNGSPETV
ncbi:MULTISPECIES: hypothetical protein [Streptomyces]|uniref:Uncharacterized protein n=1 Tax=Streptomyces sviceus (strain ATCC 29083 / DSM 924 / JCM 4929 / NBRC 13980 / NCIMB 11184 / NRRL 5439 / UC 5370) TaxID=463191 RepID=B5HP92_STRX2|nr:MULTISPECIES: hypothetical protein [Streptomyces]EDY54667.1 conserved hypothetical protein [Streptomyces sviceus ATCC 29083]MYT10485.1 hypothetical protein [Streptomyces sp. SID5470]